MLKIVFEKMKNVMWSKVSTAQILVQFGIFFCVFVFELALSSALKNKNFFGFFAESCKE